ncbi:MAG: hypothetical protein ACLFVU_05165 [Phycisphaerae bacterium]
MTRQLAAGALLTLVLAILTTAVGCSNCPELLDQKREELRAARDRIDALEDDRRDLQLSLDDAKKQIESLRALGGPERLEKLYYIDSIKLGRYTGGIDDNHDGVDEAVKIYIEPVDQHGSVIKSPGTVLVQLYDLAAPEGEQLLTECKYNVDDVAKRWAGGFGLYHYSFVCPFDKKPEHEDITIRVQFTDYLRGKTFSRQKVVEIERTPATQPSDSQ